MAEVDWERGKGIIFHVMDLRVQWDMDCYR